MCDTYLPANLVEVHAANWRETSQSGSSIVPVIRASLIDEINTAIAAAISNAESCLLWLAHDQPDLVEVREAAEEMASEARRAGQGMSRISQLLDKTEMRHSVADHIASDGSEI